MKNVGKFVNQEATVKHGAIREIGNCIFSASCLFIDPTLFIFQRNKCHIAKESVYLDYKQYDNNFYVGHKICGGKSCPKKVVDFEADNYKTYVAKVLNEEKEVYKSNYWMAPQSATGLVSLL